MKNSLRLLMALGFPLLWNACSNSSNVLSGDDSCSTSMDGFVKIASQGQKVVLGTSSKDGTLKERPEMTVVFDYDFYIGRHEVTCGDFNQMMDKFGAALNVKCESRYLPAADLTFYDAVIYANMMSRAKCLDTVYVYSSVTMDNKGHAIKMDGFEMKLDVPGYRLPTEAEWVYVANRDWEPSDSWNSGNSDSAHEVCSQFGGEVCDMAGNVKEWVNDCNGYLRDTTLTNYVGGCGDGSNGERVVKGGSFKHDVATIKLHTRGDNYPVTSSTMTAYVGFRLALGQIVNPVDASGSAISNTTRLVANAEKIRSKLGTKYVKLAFRNDATGNLDFVDFNQQALNIVEIEDKLQVYHPDISPDGSKVAFCTGREGVKEPSEIYVRNLDKKGSGLVKLETKGTGAVIPRWRVLANGDTVIVYVSEAGDNKDDAYFKSQSTWQVSFANGMFGTPKRLFDGSYHGGISDDGKLAVTGARLLRAKLENRDTIWYDGEQACNVSLANDGSKRTLFLDFGKKEGKKFIYQVHERLLIADSTGKLIQSIASPKGYSFNHSEWALNRGNLVVATLNNNVSNVNEKIVVLNTLDSSITSIVETDDNEIEYPCLWTKFNPSGKDSKWDADSAGRYSAASNQAYFMLSQKMPMLWKLKDSVELVGLGNSHMWVGLDPFVMSMPSMNLGIVPCDMHCIDYLFENYVLNHFSKLKYVVVGLDFDLWYNIDEKSDIEMDMGMDPGKAPGFDYDINHNFHKEGVDEEFVNLVMENAYPGSQEVLDKLGWDEAHDNTGWTDESGTSEIRQDPAWSNLLVNSRMQSCLADHNVSTCVDMGISPNQSGTSLDECLKKSDLNGCKAFFSGDIDKLKRLVKKAKEHDITVVGVVFPISPYYKNTNSYGRHGMLRTHAKLIFDEIQKFAKKESNFVVMDENKFGDHDYPSSMANDYDHLNADGAIQLSTRLDALIKTLK